MCTTIAAISQVLTFKQKNSAETNKLTYEAYLFHVRVNCNHCVLCT
jgi:hypothetical protein